MKVAASEPIKVIVPLSASVSHFPLSVKLPPTATPFLKVDIPVLSIVQLPGILNCSSTEYVNVPPISKCFEMANLFVLFKLEFFAKFEVSA